MFTVQIKNRSQQSTSRESEPRGVEGKRASFISRLAQSRQERKQAQEGESRIQGRGLQVSGGRTEEERPANAPPRRTEVRVPAMGHRTLRVLPPASVVSFSGRGVPEVDASLLPFSHRGDGGSEAHAARPGQGGLQLPSAFSLPTQPFHVTHCHVPLGSLCGAGCQLRDFSQQPCTSLPVSQFHGGRRKSESWRPWGPTL